MATDRPELMAAADRLPAVWKTSSYCGASGCVAVRLGGVVRIRDSKLTTSPELVFDADEWRAFVAGVKNGEFDL